MLLRHRMHCIAPAFPTRQPSPKPRLLGGSRSDTTDFHFRSNSVQLDSDAQNRPENGQEGRQFMPETSQTTARPPIPKYPPISRHAVSASGASCTVRRTLATARKPGWSLRKRATSPTRSNASAASYRLPATTRESPVHRSNPVSMPEIADLQRNQNLLLALLKSLRLPAEDGGDGKLTRSQVGQLATSAGWHN